MVVYCFIEGCKSTKYKSVKEDNKIPLTFFGFPKNPTWREKWIESLISSGHSQESVTKISKYSRICSLHFSKGCIETIGFSNGRLKPNSVPTIFPNAPKESMINTENVESSNMPSMETENIAQCKGGICQTPSKKQISMEIKPAAQCEDEIYQTVSEKQTSIEVETVVQCKSEVCQVSPKKRMCYAGDINLKNIENMTPKMLVKSLNILTKSCERKDKIINRLRVEHCHQKKKIENLEAILSKFREKNIRSQTSSDSRKKRENTKLS